jgi:predicted lipoprotein with Yx(FWY)xxD motif
MRSALLILPAAAAVIAGCGATDAGRPAGAPTATTSAKHAVVNTRHGSLGTFLVDGSGRTLYLFKKDTGPRSRCFGSCAANWPPVTTRERPEAKGAAKASLLSTSRRGRTKQVVYAGHPLYRFIGDSRPGQTNGQGLNAFGAKWWVVSPAGQAIRASGASAPSPYGY